jgi:lantibiotic modifying enzyme
VCIENFLNFYQEALEHFSNDRQSIEQVFFKNRDLGLIQHISCDLGDPHNCGRNVIIFDFSQGRKVVYKPKNLLGAQIFLDTSRALNARDSHLNLHVREILVNEDYGWEEYIEFSQCQTAEQVNTWFHSLGATLRLVQFFGGRDFWADNFIATSTHSAPIDIETLLQPTFLSKVQTANQIIFQQLASGPLASGMVYMPMNSSSSDSVNLGVFAPRRRILMPLKDVTGEKIWHELPKYLATLNAHEINPFKHRDTFLKGYEQLSNTMAEYGNDNLQDVHGFHSLAITPQRFIWRSTWDYYLLLDELSTEQVSVNGIEGDIHLQKMFRSLRKYGFDSKLAIAITSCEIDSLLNCDIPFFHVVPNSNAVLYCKKEIGFIEGETTYKEFVDRINDLQVFELNENLDQIRSGMSFSENLYYPQNIDSHKHLKSIAVTQSMVEHIGKKLCELMVKGEDGSIGLMASLYNHTTKNWYLGPLPQVGYSGLIGISFSLMELFKVTQNEQFLNICKTIVHQLMSGYSINLDANTRNILSRVVVDLDDLVLLKQLEELVKYPKQSLDQETIGNQMYIDTSQSAIPWLDSSIFHNSIESSFPQIEKRLGMGNYSYLDLCARFESLLAMEEKANAISAMGLCYASYQKNSIGGLSGGASAHAPCAIIGLASLVLMYLRVHHGSPAPFQVH